MKVNQGILPLPSVSKKLGGQHLCGETPHPHDGQQQGGKLSIQHSIYFQLNEEVHASYQEFDFIPIKELNYA